LTEIELFSQSENLAFAKEIIENICSVLENLDASMDEFTDRVLEFLSSLKITNEFHLNKVHKVLVSRVSEYILIIKHLHSQFFDELMPVMRPVDKE